MSFSVSAVSQNSPQVEADFTPKVAIKLTEAAQIKLLAAQGHSNQQIATAVGLPEALVASTLGDSTTASSTTSSATALVALSGRLSVYA